MTSEHAPVCKLQSVSPKVQGMLGRQEQCGSEVTQMGGGFWIRDSHLLTFCKAQRPYILKQGGILFTIAALKLVV